MSKQLNERCLNRNTARATATTNTGLTLCKPAEPPQRLVKEALDWLVSKRLAEFADQLYTAQEMFRLYPELVTANALPRHLRRAFIRENNRKPEDCGMLRHHSITEDLVNELMPRARELAVQEWARKPERKDTAFLKAMGIAG